MKSYDYDAVIYGGGEYCVGCAPKHKGNCVGGNLDCEECFPIFADSEADRYPVCDRCHYQHTYIALSSEGIAYEHDSAKEARGRGQDVSCPVSYCVHCRAEEAAEEA